MPPFTVGEECAGQFLVSLPHPSGLCRAWNEPSAVARARDILRRACPDVPWGELDGCSKDVFQGEEGRG